MPQIQVENLQGLQIKIPEGTTKNVLRLVQENFVDWMHACGGKGRCTSCRMQVLSGQEGLSDCTRFEEKMQDRERLKPDERLACQTIVKRGLVRVRVPNETQLPHQIYND